MSLLYQDDVGVNLIISTSNTGIPASGTLTILLEKPGGDSSTLAVIPSMVDYNTGIITYTTVAGDLDEVGTYRVQVHGVFTDADEYFNIDTFNVFERIEV